jgi:hypothetical protein
MADVYRVNFFKKLTDSTGHPVDACQGMVQVRALDQWRALEAARIKFAEVKDVRVWWLRADYESVEVLPDGRRISNSAPRSGPGHPSTSH